jgi:hypothetical protein
MATKETARRQRRKKREKKVVKCDDTSKLVCVCVRGEGGSGSVRRLHWAMDVVCDVFCSLCFLCGGAMVLSDTSDDRVAVIQQWR